MEPLKLQEIRDLYDIVRDETSKFLNDVEDILHKMNDILDDMDDGEDIKYARYLTNWVDSVYKSLLDVSY